MRGELLQVPHMCLNEFPDECVGCPDYKETRQNQTSQFFLMLAMRVVYPPIMGRLVTKECKRYHKRKVEYLR